jgi:hypothetical protein
MQNDKTVLRNRPEITLSEKTIKIVYLVDINISHSFNLQTAHIEEK